MVNDIELEETEDFIEKYWFFFKNLIEKHGQNVVIEAINELLERDEL